MTAITAEDKGKINTIRYNLHFLLLPKNRPEAKYDFIKFAYHYLKDDPEDFVN